MIKQLKNGLKWTNLFFFCMLFFLLNTAYSQDKQVEIKKATIAKTSIQFEEKSYDFATVTEGEVVEHIYTFTNSGNVPLIIETVAASCGCTIPKWSEEPILAGEKGEIEVKFDTRGKLNKQSKTITVKANTEPSLTRLTIKGMVEQRHIVKNLDGTTYEVKKDAPKSKVKKSINASYIPPPTTIGENTDPKEVVEFVEVEEEMPTKEEYGKIYDTTEKMPQFVGGQTELFKFLINNIKYPKEAKDKGIQGRVFVDFIVRKDGTITDVKLKRGLPEGGAGCDEEALRVVKSMPKWEPGIQYGKPVNVVFIIPISFRLK